MRRWSVAFRATTDADLSRGMHASPKSSDLVRHNLITGNKDTTHRNAVVALYREPAFGAPATGRLHSLAIQSVVGLGALMQSFDAQEQGTSVYQPDTSLTSPVA